MAIETETTTTSKKTLTGGCHCGAIRFEVAYDLKKGGSRCNCTICTKTAVTGALVKPEAFRLLSGEESASQYEWGHKVSKRTFCKHCGVQCFGQGHLAEIGGDFVSVNLNTLDGLDVSTLPLVYWDGRHDNWEAGPRSTPWPI